MKTIKIKRKKGSIFPMRTIDLFSIIATILVLATFFTGKTTFVSFFHDITLQNFLITLGKTISIYAVMVGIVVLSTFFLLVDFVLLIGGFTFPLTHFLWCNVFNFVVLDWWWYSSLPENIFLAVLVLFFIFNFEAETKNNIISCFYRRFGKKMKWGSLALVNIVGKYTDGLYIGLFIIKRKDL
jgi:hypothetical protein